MIDFIVNYWIEVLFALITSGLSFGYKLLADKLKENNRKQDAIEEGVQALLRARIMQDYNYYIGATRC